MREEGVVGKVEVPGQVYQRQQQLGRKGNAQDVIQGEMDVGMHCLVDGRIKLGDSSYTCQLGTIIRVQSSLCVNRDTSS